MLLVRHLANSKFGRGVETKIYTWILVTRTADFPITPTWFKGHLLIQKDL